MQIDAAADYLNKLLNRSVTTDTPLRLSSAQRARFSAWLQAAGFAISNLRLTGEFTLGALFDNEPKQQQHDKSDKSETTAPTSLLGIDIQSISEFSAAIHTGDLKADPELSRMFTQRELSYAQTRPNSKETLTGLFAAKEAIRKCRGEPQLSAEEFRQLEVLPDTAGRPTAAGYEISISHSGDFAVAAALRTPIPVSIEGPISSVVTLAADTGRPTRWLLPALLLNTLLVISLLLLTLFRLKG